MAKKKSAPSLIEWLNTRPKRTVKCSVCLDEASRTEVRAILEAMCAHGRHGISLREIGARLQDITGASFSVGSLQHHCTNHEAELWAKAKGR